MMKHYFAKPLLRLTIVMCVTFPMAFAPQIISAQSASEKHACDRLAGHPNDETLADVPGTQFADLKNHIAEASAACEVSSTSGEARQVFQLARVRLAQERFLQAEQLYTQAADAGHLQATRNLAYNLYNGLYGVSPDPARAVEYFHKLWMADDSFGAWGFAKAAKAGRGTPQNYELATTMAYTAYTLGETRACYVLGQAYADNPENPDLDSALDWFAVCIEKGHYIDDSRTAISQIRSRE